MGCSGGRNAKIIEQKKSLFSKETHGYKLTNMGLMNVKDIKHYTIIDSKFPRFYEENMTAAIENGAVRPWLTNIVPP